MLDYYFLDRQVSKHMSIIYFVAVVPSLDSYKD